MVEKEKSKEIKRLTKEISMIEEVVERLKVRNYAIEEIDIKSKRMSEGMICTVK